MIASELLRQLLDEALRLPLHLLSLDVDRAALLVVEFAVGPNLLHVRREIIHGLVLVGLKLVLHCAQVHRPFNNCRVVPELERLPRHRLEEGLRVRVLAKLRQQEEQLVALLLAEAAGRLRCSDISCPRHLFRGQILHLTNLIASRLFTGINLGLRDHWGIVRHLHLGSWPDRLILFASGLEHLERRMLHLLSREYGYGLAGRC